MGVEGGGEVIRSYGDADAERAVASNAVGLVDITVRAKLDLRGPVDDAYEPATDDVVARMTPDWMLVFAPPGPVDGRVASMAARAESVGMVTDVTHLFAGFALCGRELPGLIERLSSWDPASLEPGSAAGAPIADIPAVMVRRKTSVPILDVYIAMELARYAWRSILDEAEQLGGGPVGWDALRSLGWH